MYFEGEIQRILNRLVGIHWRKPFIGVKDAVVAQGLILISTVIQLICCYDDVIVIRNPSSNLMGTKNGGENRNKNVIYLLWVPAYSGHCFILFEGDGEGVGRVAKNFNFHPCNKLTLIIQ